MNKKRSFGEWISRTWSVVWGGVAIILGIMLIVSAYAGYISPQRVSLSSYLTLIFPLWIVLNIGLLLFWLLSLNRLLFIPLIALIITFPSIKTYSPVHLGKTEKNIAQDSLLKVLTYNVHGFANEGFQFDNQTNNKTLQLIKTIDADIVCLQEFGYSKDNRFLTLKKIRRELNQYPYFTKSTQNKMGALSTGTVIFSKYPIKQIQRVSFKDSYNSAIICQINIKDKPFMVINCHLESNQLTQEERFLYESAITSLHTNQINAAKEAIVPKIGSAMKSRAIQADTLCSIIKHRITPVIICGDFNDIPLSYSYRRIRGELNDSYESKGFGPGFTFKKNLFLVRIDHIFHSQELAAIESKVLKGGSSDHSPLVSVFRIEPHDPESQ